MKEAAKLLAGILFAGWVLASCTIAFIRESKRQTRMQEACKSSKVCPPGQEPRWLTPKSERYCGCVIAVPGEIR